MLSSTRIDRIGEALKSGDSCADDLIALDDYRQTFQPAYRRVVSVARDTLHLPVTGRPSKSTGSIREKLKRESMRLSQMQDIAGCRVIVEDTIVQKRFVEALKVFLGNPRVIDRCQTPSHGYRAIHLMPLVEDHCVEIQVRTIFQHLWAEISEKLSDTVDTRLKYGMGDEVALGMLQNLSGAIQNLEEEEVERSKFFDTLEKLSRFDRKKLLKRVRHLDSSYRYRRNDLMTSLAAISKLI